MINEHPEFDPERDLTLSRVIRAPRSAVWRAWTDPERLEQWWIPAPSRARIERLDPVPGGALVSQMSDDGQTFVPHMDAIFLAVEPEQRLVFTNALDSSWRPAAPAPVPLTAHISFLDHEKGTDYRVLVRHGSPDDRERHARLGFLDGWGAVTEALARLTESEG